MTSPIVEYMWRARKGNFLLLFDTVNVYVNLLIIKTNMTSNKSRLHRIRQHCLFEAEIESQDVSQVWLPNEKHQLQYTYL